MYGKIQFRHPFGWLIFFIVILIITYFWYWDRTPTQVVKGYIHNAVKGEWTQAKERSIGPLQNRLEKQSFEQVQTATILQESYTLIQQDYQKRVSEVQARIAVQMEGGKVDIQDQLYTLFRPEGQEWKIYRVDPEENRNKEGNLYPLRFKSMVAQETILGFIRASASGDWKKVEQMLIGEALAHFQKSQHVLPKSWVQSLIIENPTILYLGSPVIGEHDEYLVQYDLQGDHLKEITARVQLTKWDNQFFINQMEIIQEEIQG